MQKGYKLTNNITPFDFSLSGDPVCEEDIQVSAEDFYQALDHLVPSVSQAELQHYEYLKETLTVGK
jgi:SpoVK/Ycf46/Vps4 family AAA+-type ATPase